MRQELVDLYNETLPGGDITALGFDFVVAMYIESAVDHGLRAGKDIPYYGNTQQRHMRMLPPLGVERMRKIISIVRAIKAEIQERGE